MAPPPNALDAPLPSNEPVATDASVRAQSFAIARSYLGPNGDAVLRSLQQKDSARGLRHLLAHLSLITIAGLFQLYFWSLSQTSPLSSTEANATTTVTATSVAAFALLLLQAFLMSFLFMGFHELSHKTVFVSPFWNAFWGHLFGFAITRPYLYYQCYHNNHHRFTGDPDRDPELMESFVDVKLNGFGSYLWYLSGVPFWVDRSTTLLRHAMLPGSRIRSSASPLGWVLPREEQFLVPHTKRGVLREAKVYVLLYVAVAVVMMGPLGQWHVADLFAKWWRMIPFPLVEILPLSSSFAWLSELPHLTVTCLLWRLWVLPTLLAQPFLRFYLLAEHTGCPTGPDMLRGNTRTTVTVGWYRWLAWNMPWHAEHHAYPFVPFHQLGSLRAHLQTVAAAAQQRKPKTQQKEDGTTFERRHDAKEQPQKGNSACEPDGTTGYWGVHVALWKTFLGI